MIFKDINHEQAYYEFIKKARVNEWDKERKALFYLFALNRETREHINQIYNFEENVTEFEGLNQAWQTGTSTKVTKLAFNLYNGWRGEDRAEEDYSPAALFNVSSDNLLYLLEAVKIRFL